VRFLLGFGGVFMRVFALFAFGIIGLRFVDQASLEELLV
jgi:hypothetical protein